MGNGSATESSLYLSEMKIGAQISGFALRRLGSYRAPDYRFASPMALSRLTHRYRVVIAAVFTPSGTRTAASWSATILAPGNFCLYSTVSPRPISYIQPTESG